MMSQHTAQEVSKAKRRFLVMQTDEASRMIGKLALKSFHEGPWYCCEADSEADVDSCLHLFREAGIAGGTRTSNVSL